MSELSDSSSQEENHEIIDDKYFVNFNQPSSRTASRSLVVASRSGFKVFDLTEDKSLQMIYQDETESVSIIERLLNRSLVAVVFTSSPRKLNLINIKSGKDIRECSYSHNIVGVKLNPNRIVVLQENRIHIMDMKNLESLHRIDTANNPNGLCALTPSDERHKLNLLAYPGSDTMGEVCILDISRNVCTQLNSLVAHDSPLAALAFSEDGFLLATASIKGTVIRVFSVHDSRKLIEFRRGLARCVDISSLVFSVDSKFLCCSSNTETVHVFKMSDSVPKVQSSSSAQELGWMEYCTSVVSTSCKYLCSKVADVCENRAFASIYVPFSGVKSVCSITQVGDELRLLIASADGQLYVYSFDHAGKKSCELLRTFHFHTVEYIHES